MAKNIDIRPLLADLPIPLTSQNVYQAYFQALPKAEISLSSARGIANDSLEHKKLKHLAHTSFDRLWHDDNSRTQAYAWLSEQFHDRRGIINSHEGIAHMGELNAKGCVRVLNLCDRLIREKGGIEAAKKAIETWHQTEALEVQLSTGLSIPLPQEVKQQQQRDAAFIADPTQRSLPEKNREASPRLVEMPEGEALQEIENALEKIIQKIQKGKKLTPTQIVSLKAINILLSQNGLPTPEARLERIEAIRQHPELVLKIPSEVAHLQSRVLTVEAPVETPVPVAHTHPDPDKLVNRHQGRKSFVERVGRPKAIDPTKPTREEQGAKRRKERAMPITPKSAIRQRTPEEERQWQLKIYREALERMAPKELQAHLDEVLNRVIYVTDLNEDIYELSPYRLTSHSSLNPKQFFIESADKERLEVSEEEFKKINAQMEEVHICIAETRRRNQKQDRGTDSFINAYELQKKSFSFRKDISYLVLGLLNPSANPSDEKACPISRINYSDASTEIQFISQPEYAGSNAKIYVFFLEMFYHMGLPVTSLGIKDKQKEALKEAVQSAQSQSVSLGIPYPGYEEMLRDEKEVGYSIRLQVHKATTVTAKFDSRALQKVRQKAQEERIRRGESQPEASQELSFETVMYLCNGINFLTNAMFSIHAETAREEPRIDAICPLGNTKMEQALTNTLTELGIEYTQRRIKNSKNQNHIVIEAINYNSANNQRIYLLMEAQAALITKTRRLENNPDSQGREI